MPQEIEEQIPVTQQDETEQSDAQADADFAAGFDGSTPTPATTTPKEEEKAPEPEEPKPAEPEPPKYRQITEQEYRALLDRTASIDQIRAENKHALDTVFGRMGGLQQQVMERLQSQTAAGAPVELTADDLEDLNAEYPEVGARLLKSLQKIVPKLRGTGPAVSPPTLDPATFERLVNERTGSVRKELIDSHLDAVLPDWEQKVKAPEYRPWIDAQPPEVRALEASNSPREAARLLRLYGQHLASVSKPPEPKPSTRQRQLQAAVNPRSASGQSAGSTAEDDFLAGFNS